MPRVILASIVAATLSVASQSADARILITVDKSVQQMTVEVDGVTRWQWPVSTGRRGYATPSGTFTAFRMEKSHFSKEFDDAPMPNSIFFTKRGHAIHGSYDRRLGAAVSHGCVRLSPVNAAKLYALVAQRGVTTATVMVTGGAPLVARPGVPPEQTDEPTYQEPPVFRGFPGWQPWPGYERRNDDPYRRGGYGGPPYQRW
jgi:L,D-transpeptidase catalytic domain